MKTLKNFVMFLVLLSGAAILMAQTPEWQWAVAATGPEDCGHYGWYIATDSKGNQYVTGCFAATVNFGSHTLTSNGSWDIFVAKLDADGNWLWAVNAGGAGSDLGREIAIDGAGNIYVTGYFNSTATFGDHTLTSSGYPDIFVAKLDVDGNWLWAAQAGGADTDCGRSIAFDSEGNAYITGSFVNMASFGSHTLTSIETTGIFVAKLDAEGNWLWAVKATGLNTHSNGESFYIVLDDAGDAYLTGLIRGTVSFGDFILTESGNNDIFVAKLGADGNWLWAVKAGGVFSDRGDSIALDGAGNIYVTGHFMGAATFGNYSLTVSGDGHSKDIFVAKLDADGNWLWVVQAGGSSDGAGFGMALDNTGNPYVVGMFEDTASFGGHTLTSNGDWDIFVAKLDADGNWLWAVQAGGPALDSGYSIAFDAAGNAYVTGAFGGTATFGDHTLTANGILDIFVAKLGSGTPVDDYLAPQVASRLHDAWPNPFNKATGTLIKADIPAQSTGTLSVYNLRGQRVASYELSSGTHEINFAGENLSAGVYFYSLQCGSFRETKKLVLLR